MTHLLIYNDEGKIVRALTSSKPKADWDISVYGLEPDESMKLLDDAELPDNFDMARYLYDGVDFIYTGLSPEDIDQARAEELLATSPPVITLPEIWELLRIFGRKLGYEEGQ